jgi:putative salt-induced outer membrane protein YdiY
MNVLKILPVETNFWRHLEGSVDLGFSFTSGNDQYDADLSSSVTYRRGDNKLTGSFDSSFSGQHKGTKTKRNEVTFDYRRQLSPTWFAGAFFDALHSDHQSLDLRTTAGGLFGRNLIATERTRLSAFGGVAVSREKYTVEPDVLKATNFDAIAGLDFTTFRFDSTTITSGFRVYPSITTPGRMRAQLKSDLNIKIAKDFWWGFHVYENFDSKPPISAEKNDLRVSTSIGWKF